MSGGKDSFERSMKKLEKIVEELDRGEFTLEESLEKFEEAVKLGRSCKEILEQAEARVKKLVEDSEGSLVEKDVSDEL